MNNAYKEGMPYEILICRAFKCLRGTKHGADSSIMNHLINAENGLSITGTPTVEMQFGTVTRNIRMALEKLSKFKLSATESTQIKNLMNKLDIASSSSDLISIVDSALIYTERFKEYSL